MQSTFKKPGWLMALFLVISLNFSVGYAQDARLDSIKELAFKKPPGKIQVDNLLKLARGYMRESSQKAVETAELALSIADSLQYLKGMGKAYDIIGKSYYQWRHLDKASESIHKAIAVQTEIGDSMGIAWSYLTLASLYTDRQLYNEGIESVEVAANIFRNKHDKENLIAAKHTKAIILSNQDLYEEASAIYKENLAELEAAEVPNKFFLAATLNNLGNVYRQQEKYATAIPYLKRSLKLKEELKDIFRSATSAHNLAQSYLELGQLDEAEAYLNTGIAQAKSSQNEEALFDLMKVQASLLEKKGMYKEALEIIKSANEKRDSTEKADREQEIENLLLAFKTDKDRQEIDQLKSKNEIMEAENERNNQLLLYAIIAGIIFLLLTIGLFFLSKQNKAKAQVLENQNALITQQNHAIQAKNAQLSDANAQLEEVNQEKDGLMGIVAHDLKAPLNKSIMIVRLIRKTGELNPQQIKFCEKLEEINDEAGSLIDEILELNAVEVDGSKETGVAFDASELITDILQGFEAAAESKNIDLQLVGAEAPTHMFGFPDYLKRVLDNLISNALKFSQKGKPVQVHIKKDAQQVQLSIIDQGPGISPEDQQRMFRKFQRLSAKPTAGESSTGLGLSIVKSLMDKMGGEIKVQSQLGKGTTFLLMLPQKSDPPS